MNRRRQWMTVLAVMILSAGSVWSQSPSGSSAPKAVAYPWLADLEEPVPPTAPLVDHLPDPAHARRITLEPGSFGHWLRHLPVRLDRREIRTWRNRPAGRPTAAAIVLLDLGRGDLHQCADTLYRLRAEWLWATGRGGEASFHFTSGQPSRWADWVRGETFIPRGQRAVPTQRPPRAADHRSYRKWLQQLFIWAGSRSLALDSRLLVDGEHLEPGDILVLPGAPGHAVILLDLAVDGDGGRWALVGEGYTPAQDVQVIPGRNGSPWFRLPGGSGESLRLPTWPRPFPLSSARRFQSPD